MSDPTNALAHHEEKGEEVEEQKSCGSCADCPRRASPSSSSSSSSSCSSSAAPVDIEDLAAGPAGGVRAKQCAGHQRRAGAGAIAARRRQFAASAANAEPSGVYDVVIVGAGVVGSSIARELSRFKLSVAVLESFPDVAQGASKANSGIVHGGYNAKNGTLKAKLSYRGNRMYERLNEELNFGHKEVGGLVIAFSDADKEMLRREHLNGQRNGVPNLQFLEPEQIRAMEPTVSFAAKQALYCPHIGVTSPYEQTIAMAENAIHNGVRFFFNSAVTGVERVEGAVTTTGSGSGAGDAAVPGHHFVVRTCTGREVRATKVINCAGLYSDEVSRMVGAEGLTMLPRKGEYVVLSRNEGARVQHVLFQAPTERWGKGILVAPTVAGNLMVGPSAADVHDKMDKSTTLEELAYIAWAARRTVPTLDLGETLTSFAGLRSRSVGHDFIIEESAKVPGFVNVAGIESPGLTSSPAIAEMVGDIVLDSFRKLQGREVPRRPDFDPYRPPIRFSKPSDFDGEVDHPDPDLNIICRCEKVTEREIVDSIHRGIPLSATDSVKWRTRAGMGHCQGQFCQPRVARLLLRETGVQPTKHVVPHEGCAGRHAEFNERPRAARELLSKL